MTKHPSSHCLFLVFFIVILIQGCGVLVEHQERVSKFKVFREMELEHKKLSKENGVTGWLTYRHVKRPILRLGDMETSDRWFILPENKETHKIPLEQIRSMTFLGDQILVETHDEKSFTVSQRDLQKRVYNSRYRTYWFSRESLDFILLSDSGLPSKLRIGESNNIQRIELNTNFLHVAIPEKGGIPDSVIESAKTEFLPLVESLRQIEQEGREEREIAEAKRVEEQNVRKAKLLEEQENRLDAFRKNLKIGDDTFCGPVIEIRGPMVKIAVIPQLQGFASESWLKVEQIYPASFGCFNLDGRLLPIKRN